MREFALACDEEAPPPSSWASPLPLGWPSHMGCLTAGERTLYRKIKEYNIYPPQA